MPPCNTGDTRLPGTQCSLSSLCVALGNGPSVSGLATGQEARQGCAAGRLRLNSQDSRWDTAPPVRVGASRVDRRKTAYPYFEYFGSGVDPGPVLFVYLQLTAQDERSAAMSCSTRHETDVYMLGPRQLKSSDCRHV